MYTFHVPKNAHQHNFFKDDNSFKTLKKFFFSKLTNVIKHEKKILFQISNHGMNLANVKTTWSSFVKCTFYIAINFIKYSYDMYNMLLHV